MIHAIVLPEKNSNENTIPIKTTLVTSVGKTITKFNIDCPVEIRNYEIFVNEQQLTYCAIDFFNLSTQTVQAIDLTLLCYDSFGMTAATNNAVQALMQDECASHKQHFGKNKTIPLPNHLSTRTLEVIINKILFSDGSTWEKENNQLREVKIERITDKLELDKIRSIVGFDAYCYPKELEDVWICVCGKLNKNIDPICRRCNREKSFVLTNYNQEGIEKSTNRNLHNQEVASKKRRKTYTISILAIIILLVGVGFGVSMINQKRAYDSLLSQANFAMGNGNYDEAISLFESSLLSKEVPSVKKSIQLADNLQKAQQDANSHKYDLALGDLENVFKIDPNNADAQKLKTVYTAAISQQKEDLIAEQKEIARLAKETRQISPGQAVAPQEGNVEVKNGIELFNLQRATIKSKGFTVGTENNTEPDAQVADGFGNTLYPWVAFETGSATGESQQVFFFIGQKYLGTDTQESHGPTESITAGDTGSMIVTYIVYQKNDPMSSPTGKPFKITYHWNGQKLVASTPFQPQFLSY